MTGDMEVLHGDCLEQMRGLAEASVDSIVTDPPYELSFMGKGWDATGIANSVELWREAFRVLKPGGHLLAFSATRTQHRMVCAIEDAGFEIRDQIGWMYGTGFPKGEQWTQAKVDKGNAESAQMLAAGFEGWARGGLKPAWEPICVARKPLSEGTVAANVLAHGTGALNIDACRVATDENLNGGAYAKNGTERDDGWGMQRAGAGNYIQTAGRWPANVIHDGSDEVLEAFAAFGESKSGAMKREVGAYPGDSVTGFLRGRSGPSNQHGDSGTAARFFYSAKASKADRAGSKHPTVKPIALMRYLCKLVTPPGGLILDPFAGSGTPLAAAHMEGFRSIGIEREPEYIADIRRRKEDIAATTQPAPQGGLFDSYKEAAE